MMNFPATVAPWMLLCFLVGSWELRSAELPPDDATLTGSLTLWLKNSESNYDAAAGVWVDSSGRGNDATGVGQVGAVTYANPTLADVPGSRLFPGDTLSGVHFRGNADDLLATPPLNGGLGLTDLTIFVVYRNSDRDGLSRPAGFGSIAAIQSNPGNHFNLASDPSLRKDNGFIGGYSRSIPFNELFIRTARMDAGGVDEWFNEEGVLIPVLRGGGPAFRTSTDRFYLGDLRCGPTPVPGFGGATSLADSDVVEVIVYASALTDEQVAGVNEWLTGNVGSPTPPRITSFFADPGAMASGESATLSWEVEHADTVTISQGVGTVASTGTRLVSPQVTTTYLLTASGEGGTTEAEVTLGVDVPVADPFLSEFLASNATSLLDEDGDRSDWIELANPNSFGVTLEGLFLTDDPTNLQKWSLPAEARIEGNGFLVVFASGKDRHGGEEHTNFGIDRDGGYLALTDGVREISAVSYPEQVTDYSYGVDSNEAVRFLLPTPGAENGEGLLGRVGDTRFSIDRGFYRDPFSVIIATDTPGAEIRYTTDGTEPTATHGTVYVGPVLIGKTTVLRAAAFKPGFIPTNVDTQSYLFLDQVIRQPANPDGAPDRWGDRIPDYAMDQRVVDDPAYSSALREGLRSIRTLSIVADPAEFFDGPEAIYANPQNDGRAWEREVSFEFLHPDLPADDVQVNGGIRIHGNGSRSPSGQPKHSFRVEFRGEYGVKRLSYRLFHGTRVDEFDNLILRGQNAHGWTRASQIANDVGTSEREQSQYLRDSYARDLMKNMGNTSGEATYVHLYINGLYWGLYNPVEYPRSYYGVSYFGGEEKDYDVINRRTVTTKILDGNFDAWNDMQALADGGLTSRAAYEDMESRIDLDNLIDYMLMHQYMGSRDGPEVFNSNNMRALAKTRGDTRHPWICMPWDMEASMFEIDVTRNVNVDDPNTLVRIYTRMRANPEFRLRYADRVYRHCFHEGALTPSRTAASWETRAGEIFTAIVGESARWGDYRRPSLPFTRDVEWQQERTRLLTTYFPTRTDFLVNLLRQNNLYPDVAAPEFSQHGGRVSPGFAVTMTADQGVIHFTLDGSDPREAWTGTAVGTVFSGPVALQESVTLKARALHNGEWSALNSVDFVVGTVAQAGNLAISELHYHPSELTGEEEFIELVNRSNGPLELDGVSFSAGLTYTFPVGSTLPAGERMVLTPLDYLGRLDNGGELITLLDREGQVIESFRYGDDPPWPDAPDGGGPSLTRVLGPGALNDPADPLSWRASSIDGGTPGTDDAVFFSGDPGDDLDQDGLTALMEHALGTSDGEFTALDSVLRVTLEPGGLVISHPVSATADDASIIVEQSSDLINWEQAPVTLTANEALRVYSLDRSAEIRFYRLSVSR